MGDMLQHVGIMGMRWGRRKGRDTSSSDHKTAVHLKGKKLKDMSNEELRTLATRIRLEREHKNDINPGKFTRGKNHVSNALKMIGGMTAAAGTITAAAALGKKLYKSYSDSPIAQKIVRNYRPEMVY